MYCTLIWPIRKVTNPGRVLYADVMISVSVMMQGRNFESGLEKQFFTAQHERRHRGGFSHRSTLSEGHLLPDGLRRMYYDK